jgi:hypothetical protein
VDNIPESVDKIAESISRDAEVTLGNRWQSDFLT